MPWGTISPTFERFPLTLFEPSKDCPQSVLAEDNLVALLAFPLKEVAVTLPTKVIFPVESSTAYCDPSASLI